MGLTGVSLPVAHWSSDDDASRREVIAGERVIGAVT